MAIGSTIYNFEINLSDVARAEYQTFSLALARHPSETLEYLLTRLLAYCLEYCEGLEFSKGLADAEAPALWVHDLTGQLKVWIEIGAPSAERVHRASKKVERLVIYTYKNPALVMQEFAGQRIQNSERILLHAVDANFLSELSTIIQKRNVIDVVISDGQIYLDLAGKNLSTSLKTCALT